MTARIAFLFLLFLSACTEEMKVLPTSQENAETIFKQHFASNGLQVREVPAFFSENWGHWTSVLYVNGTCYRAYIRPDGRVFSLRTQPLHPVGIQKVLCVIVDHPNLNLSANLFHWEKAQELINEEHMAYSTTLGVDPIVQFENTNILLEPALFESDRELDVYAALTLNGIDYHGYDIVAFIDLDTSSKSGGFAVPEGKYLKIGWFYDANVPTTITEERMKGVANAVYHHETGHLWGWEHEWSDADTVNYFITETALFGWTDVDGDGIIEILDSNPYGL